ncbi:hypothetical protein G1H11_14205 [Phytoactinopolyspora alkaliphila]|uniref:Helix-turn-helix DNA binding domain protein n=1 Tax=Phytoactinopolyspora alkaliphila TaxID=1783498 RepID=A0A6N9YNP5_9ACTN|nr:hypothetical protein [Phytoactinopolyspora alkaliphila]NED96459.1 hypothetical protein [Phytoactinopolyspora alkaliphila]
MNQQMCAAGCGRPTSGSALCHTKERSCEERMVREVAELPSIGDDLDLARTRQAVLGSGGRSSETPVPWDDRVARVQAAFVGAMWTWTMAIWDHVEPLPTGGLPGIGRWMHARINRLLDHPDVGEFANTLHRHTRRALKVIDRPAEGLFAGICSARTPKGECPEWLYALPGKSIVTCRVCGAHYDVAWRREILRQHAENTLMTAAEIARAVTWLDTQVRADRVRQWASRGRLIRRGSDEQGRPTYRLGDVLDLAAAEEQRRNKAKAS